MVVARTYEYISNQRDFWNEKPDEKIKMFSRETFDAMNGEGVSIG
jgi:hypothetical protein